MPLTLSSGGGGGTPPVPTLRITGFTNNVNIAERGTVVNTIGFNWSYLNDSNLTQQSISPQVGTIANTLRSTTLNGANITDDTTFTLQATDSSVNRSVNSNIRFYYPILWGSIDGNAGDIPTEAQILSMNHRVSEFTDFTATLNISNARSCFVSPMTNPITDIRETSFNLSILNTYTIYNNFFVTMLDGVVVPCRVLVKSALEDTSGLDFNLRIIF
jgi:hypothetical protein